MKPFFVKAKFSICFCQNSRPSHMRLETLLWLKPRQSFHPSILFHLSGTEQQSKQRCSDFPLLGHFVLFLWGDSQAFQASGKTWSLQHVPDLPGVSVWWDMSATPSQGSIQPDARATSAERNFPVSWKAKRIPKPLRDFFDGFVSFLLLEMWTTYTSPSVGNAAVSCLSLLGSEEVSEVSQSLVSLFWNCSNSLCLHEKKIKLESRCTPLLHLFYRMSLDLIFCRTGWSKSLCHCKEDFFNVYIIV